MPTMESSWALLLLVGLVTATPVEPPKTTEEALSRFIKLYNQGPNVQNAFRVWQARPQPTQSLGSGTLQPLNFTIQETVCPASKKAAIEQCEFKPDGLMKDCSGYFSTKQTNSLIVASCETVQGPVHTTRFRALGSLLKVFGKLFRRGGNNNE